MDWTTQIKCGKAAISVHFVGGALTAYGVTPAKYTTNNPFFQNIIEHSEQFKSGKIRLISSAEEPGDVEKNVKQAAQNQEEDTPGNDITSTEETAVNTAETSPGDEETKPIEVSDRWDAVEWLKENYPEKGYTSTKLRTKTAFEAACNECGVTFVFQNEETE